MAVFICGTWADWFWSSEIGRSGRFCKPCRQTLLRAHIPSRHDLDSLPEPFSSFPLPAQVLLSDPAERNKAKHVEAHVWRGAVPAGTFRRIDGNWFVAGPEFTFLNLAARLDVSELIAIGYEYCGTYAINPLNAESTSGMRAITTPQKIERFLNQWGGARGVAKAKEALRYVHANSASPRETEIHMRLSLSGHRGGYSLPLSLINHKVELDEVARRIYKRGSCRCDVFFPKINLDVEYNGKDHEGRMESDAARAAALASMGIVTLTITKRQYEDYLAMSGIVRSIAAAHGIYLNENRTSYTTARAKLMMALRDYSTAVNRR